MKIFDPSTTVRVGDAIRLPLYCSEPGSVIVTSSDEGVASVGSPVTVGGSRTWRNGLKQGEHLTREGASSANRLDVSFCFEVDKNVYDGEANSIGGGACSVFGNMLRDNWNRDNYRFWYAPYLFSFRFKYLESANSGANTSDRGTLFEASQATLQTPFRFIVELTQSDLKINTYHTDTFGTPKTILSRIAGTTGTMGGTETLFITKGIKVAKFERLLTEQERSNYVTGNVLPPNALFSFQGEHEIIKTNPVFWDSSGTLDLTNVSSLRGWPTAAASGDYTDTPGDPVQPYQYIDVLAQGVGATTITARRRRNGVPYRTPALPDAEVYEETTYVLTVAAATALEQATVQLMIYADRDGTATIAMDNPIIAFPASVPVVEGKNQVSGLVTGSGTCDVTVTLDGVSDVTTFDVEEILTRIKTGPRQIYQVYL